MTALKRCGALLLPLSLCSLVYARPQARILDLKHYSRVFGEERNFRVFLPPGYDAESSKRYPVVYFFHGWGERYNRPPRTGGNYDVGGDYGGDTIAAFVGRNDLIVVKWDGYNPRKPGEEYPRPYNISPVETHRQFPLYFPELVEHIDANFRTLADRDHRGTSGLSMGGFMSFWIAGKYPHLVGSASNFMGSSEFFVGPNGFPSEYRHTEMHRNYEGLRTRIVIGTRDFIRWYHRRMNLIWDFTRRYHEHEDFDSEHGTPGMSRTLEFHMAAFRNPLPPPALWHHADVYPSFEVWGWSVTTDRRRPGFTLLENVSRDGFRCVVREWLPGGPTMPHVTVRLTTEAFYKAAKAYTITDVNLDSGEARRIRRTADNSGRLHLLLDGARHEVGIAEAERPILSVSDWRLSNGAWAVAGRPVRLKLLLVNKGARTARGISAVATSPNPGVTFESARVSLGSLPPGAITAARGEVIFTVRDTEREIARLMVRLTADGATPAEVPLDIPLFRAMDSVNGIRVMDGLKLPLFTRAVHRIEQALGTGNADGVANPGETIAIAVPEGDGFRAAELFSSDACVDLGVRLSDPWAGYDSVGATHKISLPLISAGCPEGHEIPFFLRYQVPNKPEHILKEGFVRVRVTGRDRTPPEVRWAQLRHWNRLEVELRDGGRISSARATLTRGELALTFPLNDEGREADAAAGDRVFTGLVPNPAPGVYSLEIWAADEFGNSKQTRVEGEFHFSLPPPAPAAVR